MFLWSNHKTRNELLDFASISWSWKELKLIAEIAWSDEVRTETRSIITGNPLRFTIRRRNTYVCTAGQQRPTRLSIFYRNLWYSLVSFFFFRSLNIYSAFESIRQLRRTMILERFTEILNENRLGCVISISTRYRGTFNVKKKKKFTFKSCFGICVNVCNLETSRNNERPCDKCCWCNCIIW